MVMTTYADACGVDSQQLLDEIPMNRDCNDGGSADDSDGDNDDDSADGSDDDNADGSTDGSDDDSDGDSADGSDDDNACLLYTSPSPRDAVVSRMPSSA